MAIDLQAIVPRHEYRIRLVFTTTLGVGAFGFSPTFYTVENQDGLGASPTVSAAMVVTGSPASVELALSTPLVHGALYKVSAVGVPAADASVTPSGSHEMMRFGATLAPENKEPSASQRDVLLYGIDLLWTGADFHETATGDLDRVGGTPNLVKALNRGVISNGLPYDYSWGAKAREYVDSPQGAAGTLKGALEAQILRDPRVRSVTVTFEVVGAATYLHAVPILVSGEKLERVTMVVPNE